MVSPAVSVIVLAWDDVDYTERCVSSLSVAASVPVEVVVVDNGSTPTLAAKLEGLCRKAGATYVRSELNVGYGRGMNLGLGYVNAPITVLSNNDLVYWPGALDALAAELQDPTVGLTSPRVFGADGGEELRGGRFLTTRQALALVFFLNVFGPKRFGLRPPVADADWLPGSCLALRTADLMSWGGVSTASFMYGEDMRLCFESRRRGLRLAISAGSSVTHLQSISAARRWSTIELARLRTLHLLWGSYEFFPRQPWWRWAAFLFASAERVVLKPGRHNLGILMAAWQARPGSYYSDRGVPNHVLNSR